MSLNNGGLQTTTAAVVPNHAQPASQSIRPTEPYGKGSWNTIDLAVSTIAGPLSVYAIETVMPPADYAVGFSLIPYYEPRYMSGRQFELFDNSN